MVNPLYQEALMTALQQNGIQDPADVLSGLLRLLHVLHRNLDKDFNDGLDNWTGKHAISLADSLANIAATLSALDRANGTSARKRGDLKRAEAFEALAAQRQCLSDLIRQLLPTWKKEADALAEKIAGMIFELEMQNPDPDTPTT